MHTDYNIRSIINYISLLLIRSLPLYYLLLGQTPDIHARLFCCGFKAQAVVHKVPERSLMVECLWYQYLRFTTRLELPHHLLSYH